RFPSWDRMISLAKPFAFQSIGSRTLAESTRPIGGTAGELGNGSPLQNLVAAVMLGRRGANHEVRYGSGAFRNPSASDSSLRLPSGPVDDARTRGCALMRW